MGLDDLDQKLTVGGYQTYAQPNNPMSGFGGIGSPNSGPQPAAFVPYSVQEKGEFAKKRLKVLADVKTAQADVSKNAQAIQSLMALPQPPSSAVAQPGALGSSLPPLPQGTNSPSLPPMPQPTTPTTPPVPQQPGQGPTLPQTSSQPFPAGLNVGNAFAALNARNTLQRIFGTSDQNALARAKNYAQSVLGISDDDLQNGLQASVNGDPNAIARSRKIIALANPGIFGGSDSGTDYDSPAAPVASAQDLPSMPDELSVPPVPDYS